VSEVVVCFLCVVRCHCSCLHSLLSRRFVSVCFGTWLDLFVVRRRDLYSCFFYALSLPPVARIKQPLVLSMYFFFVSSVDISTHDKLGHIDISIWPSLSCLIDSCRGCIRWLVPPWTVMRTLGVCMSAVRLLLPSLSSD
jgi:hypothetical protein